MDSGANPPKKRQGTVRTSYNYKPQRVKTNHKLLFNSIKKQLPYRQPGPPLRPNPEAAAVAACRAGLYDLTPPLSTRGLAQLAKQRRRASLRLATLFLCPLAPLFLCLFASLPLCPFASLFLCYFASLFFTTLDIMTFNLIT